jgi:hypothetical protein
MVTLDGTPVSQSLHRYWREIGGAQGMARALKTDLKVKYRGFNDDHYYMMKYLYYNYCFYHILTSFFYRKVSMVALMTFNIDVQCKSSPISLYL